MPTPIFLTGWEAGTATPYGTASGTVTIDGTAVRNGAYSLRTTGAGADMLTVSVAAGNRIGVASLYFRYSNLPTGARGGIFRFNTAVNTVAFQLTLAGVANMYVGTQIGVNGPTLSTNTWYRLDVRANTSTTTNWVVDWQITRDSDGVLLDSQSVSGINQTASDITSVNFGNHGTATWSDFFTDDVFVSVTSADYPIGAHKVVRLSPASDGTHNTGAAGNFTDAAGTNITDATTTAWQHVEEIPPTITERIEQRRDTSGTLYVEIAFDQQSEVRYNGVMAWLGEHSAAAQGSAGEVRVRRVDTTEFSLINGDFATALTYHSVIVNPPAAGWTDSEIDGLRVRCGYGTDVTPDIYIDWLMLELDVPILTVKGRDLIMVRQAVNRAAVI